MYVRQNNVTLRFTSISIQNNTIFIRNFIIPKSPFEALFLSSHYLIEFLFSPQIDIILEGHLPVTKSVERTKEVCK